LTAFLAHAERLANRSDREIAITFAGGHGRDKQKEALVDLEVILSVVLKTKFSFPKEIPR